MAIAIDGSTPAALDPTSTSSGTETTASFSPPINSMVVIVVNLGYGVSTTAPAVTCADSLGNSYTAGPNVYSTLYANTSIFTRFYTSAPGSITVTVTRTGALGVALFQVVPYVLTGAASNQSGAGSNNASGTSTTTYTHSFTTTTTNSWSIVGVAAGFAQSGAPTPVIVTTDHSALDGTDGSAGTAGHAANGAPGTSTIGWTWSNSGDFTWAALEILPTGAGTPPAVVTQAASSITSSGAVLNGTVNPQSLATTYQFEYGLTTAYGTQVPGTPGSAGSGAIPVAESFTLTGLTGGTLYHFRLNATNTAGTTHGSDLTFTTSAGGASIVQQVSGSVINDYGLDNVPFVMQNPNIPSLGTMGNSLVAFIGWDVAFFSYQSSGKSPAVNVTDSAGNLWRQIGITAMNTGSRAAIWMTVNAFPVDWVSVAVTGWSYCTTYTICEVAGLPSTMQQVSIDFVQTAVTNSAVTTLTVPSGTASVSDVCFGLMTVGTNASAMTTPAGWSPLTVAPVSPAQYTETVFPFWIPSKSAGTAAFAPSWTTAGPAAGIIVGLKQNAPAPVQPNPAFPFVIIEAAFGANPGDWTQSTDYTYSVEGVTWTDISTKCISAAGEGRIEITRGRSYELNQDETGEMHIPLDNHDGTFTTGNTSSPYYPHVIPGVPVRVTAWWSQTTGNPCQYPIGYGYVERWPQSWPDLPQWGFTEMVATDALGPLANTSLPSAVEGDIKKDLPYAYFPTDEQYSFTQQALELAGVKTPIDAHGFYALNRAFGNNRVGAYRDGANGIPAATGSALNLLGDSDTAFGFTSYPGQVPNVGGPGMFYFDSALPTNSTGTQSFSYEFWFLLGWPSESFRCTLMSLFGGQSTYFDNANTSPVGAVLTIGANMSKTQGLWVNGVNVATKTTSPAFTATNTNAYHFVITCSPANGTTTYLNGRKTAVQPANLVSIPVIKAMVLGPARFSYDNNAKIDYQGYNFVSGHLAAYPQELTPTMIANHYNTGVTGYIAQSAPRRFSQALTWGLLGLKRGGCMWVANHGTTENTLISEAYSFEGSTAADIVAQLTKTEGGRVFSTANGSVVYLPRWVLYNQPQSALFGDSLGTAVFSGAPVEIPVAQDLAFSLDNTFIYNTISSTQTRGPNTDIFFEQTNTASQQQYFNKSALSMQSEAMSPFDVYGQVNWAAAKYNNPTVRVDGITIDVASAQGKQPAAFSSVLHLDLQDGVTVTRRPLGGAQIQVVGAIQQLTHNIGANTWQIKYQVAPRFPESNALTADMTGWSFTASGTPSAKNYFVVSTGQSLSVSPGDQFTDGNNPGVTFTVLNLGTPFAGFVNVTFTPTAANTMSSPDVVSQVPFNTLGTNFLSWLTLCDHTSTLCSF